MLFSYCSLFLHLDRFQFSQLIRSFLVYRVRKLVASFILRRINQAFRRRRSDKHRNFIAVYMLFREFLQLFRKSCEFSERILHFNRQIER